MSVGDIIANQPVTLQSASPVIDGVVLPVPFRDAFQSGNFNRVPVIQGSNHDEMRLFVALLFDLQGGPVTEAGYPAAVASLLGVPQSVADILIPHYPVANYASPGLALSALATDAAFACNALAADRYLSGFVKTYAYEFDDATAPQLFLPPASFPYAAAHASEIQYLFDLPSPFPPQPLNADQQQLSDAMARYWTRFAKSGKPTAPHAPRWPRYDTEDAGGARMLSLVSPTPETKLDTFFRFDHQCGFWDNILGN